MWQFNEEQKQFEDTNAKRFSHNSSKVDEINENTTPSELADIISRKITILIKTQLAETK